MIIYCGITYDRGVVKNNVVGIVKKRGPGWFGHRSGRRESQPYQFVAGYVLLGNWSIFPSLALPPSIIKRVIAGSPATSETK